VTELDAIRVARADEAALVSEVLTEAAQWIREHGEPLWSEEELSPRAVSADVRAGLFVLAFASGRAVGVVRLAEDDSLFWPDAVRGEAVYIHRLAVRRSHAGGAISRPLIDWASARGLELGCSYLRLDCVASRLRLRAAYERYGFRFHSERAVGSHLVARYQRETGIALGSELGS
jgi:GNAT superfamily N-acetyltransferase